MFSVAFSNGICAWKKHTWEHIVAQELVHSMNRMTGKKCYFVIEVD